MPGQRSPVLDWPYVEGLRMDEAMHPLTMLAFGLYGEVLPNQNGAPVRLVVPWKYGFKSAQVASSRSASSSSSPQTAWRSRRAAGVRLLLQRESRRSIIRAGARPPSGASAAGLFQRKSPTLMFNGYEAAGRAALRRHGPEEASERVTELLRKRSSVFARQAAAVRALRLPGCWCGVRPTRSAPTRPRR